MKDIIFINKMATQAVIGVYDFEKVAPQKLIISVELGTDITQAAETDSVEHALNYDAISRFIDDTVRASRFDLLEALAKHLIDALFENFAMSSIRLTIEKPGAISYTQAVGLTIYRERV